MYKLGILGIGNMGSAVLEGLLKSEIVAKDQIIIYDLNEVATKKYKELGIELASSDKELAEKSESIFLALGPQILETVGQKLKGSIKAGSLIISIAAGTTISQLEEYFGSDKKYIRVMSNTPATIGEGMTAICPGKGIADEDLDFTKEIFSSIGEVVQVSEDEIAIFTGFIGSLPAYVFMFIEAVADGAVAEGFDRKDVYKMIGQTVQGSAKLLMETGKHPGELKDQVTSPGGTTIAGVTLLEEEGFRNALIKAVRAASQRAKGI